VPVASCQFIFRKVKSSVTLSSCLCALFYRSRPAWVHAPFSPGRRKSPKPSVTSVRCFPPPNAETLTPNAETLNAER
jgi:hypothetical protein